MKIIALGIHTPWSRYGADCGWCISWHHPKDITWRWGATFDYFWRKRGFSGDRPEHVRKWKWSFLIPRAFQSIWQRHPAPFLPIPGVDYKKWNWNPYGGFGCSWLGFDFYFSYQPKWDRSFDAEKYRREEQQKERHAEIMQAFREKQRDRITIQ